MFARYGVLIDWEQTVGIVTCTPIVVEKQIAGRVPGRREYQFVRVEAALPAM